MAVTLRRQLSDEEKMLILERHGRKCFATGHEIPAEDPVQFDHIRAFSEGGDTELNNIAPMCGPHNRDKGTLPLEEYRVKLLLRAFFSTGDSLTLRDLLNYLKTKGEFAGYGQSVAIHAQDGNVQIETASKLYTYPLYSCPTTGWKYFYATLPIDVLDSDDGEDGNAGLQPRYLIFDKVFELYQHFQRHPVLLPSVGRVRDHRIFLFDGQHKIAALLWTGRREFECKIYLDPDLRLLNQTNISAHDKFAQTRFYSSIMVLKLGGEFGADFEKYKNSEDGMPKSEAGFMRYLEHDPSQSMTRADRNRRFRSYLYNSILQDEDNKLTRFVSTANRSTDEKPLTIDMLSKSIFACFLYPEPVDDDMTTDAYRRDREVSNIVLLMNMLHDLALGAWNPKANVHDGTQRKLARLFRSRAVMAWTELLKDSVCAKLDIVDAEDRLRPFYRELTKSQLDLVKRCVERLVAWQMWAAPPDSEIDRILADNKSAIKAWLKDKGLTTGYIMGAPE